MRHVLIAIVAVALMSQSSRAAELSIVGAWVLNKDLTPMPDGTQRPANGERRPPRGGSSGGGGRGGFGGGGQGPSEEQIHKMEAIRDRLSEIPERLTITSTETTVTIADAFGRTATLNTNGKKQPRVTGEGEFNSKTHFDGAKLVVEDDFNGPKITTTYEPLLDQGEIRQLKVTLHVDGMGGGGGRGMGGSPPGGGGFGGGGGMGRGGGRGGPPPQGDRGGAEGQRPGREVVRIYDEEK